MIELFYLLLSYEETILKYGFFKNKYFFKNILEIKQI